MDPEAPKQCNTCHKTEGEVLSCVCHTVFYCNKECQKKDRKAHKKSCLPYVVKEVEGKGRGLFATRDIAQAEVILIEDPVLTIEADMNQNVGSKKLLNDYSKLPPKVQSDILKLHDAFGMTSQCLETRLWNIIHTNSIKKWNAGQYLEKSLYLKTSGFNHSCNPNTTWVYKDRTIMIVKALVPIKRGEELVKDYMWTPFDDRGENGLCREERRAKIKKKYNFDCLCNVCSKNDPETQCWERAG